MPAISIHIKTKHTTAHSHTHRLFGLYVQEATISTIPKIVNQISKSNAIIMNNQNANTSEKCHNLKSLFDAQWCEKKNPVSIFIETTKYNVLLSI